MTPRLVIRIKMTIFTILHSLPIILTHRSWRDSTYVFLRIWTWWFLNKCDTSNLPPPSDRLKGLSWIFLPCLFFRSPVFSVLPVRSKLKVVFSLLRRSFRCCAFLCFLLYLSFFLLVSFCFRLSSVWVLEAVVDVVDEVVVTRGVILSGRSKRSDRSTWSLFERSLFDPLKNMITVFYNHVLKKPYFDQQIKYIVTSNPTTISAYYNTIKRITILIAACFQLVFKMIKK